MDQRIFEELRAMLTKEAARLQKELASFAKPDPRMRGDWDTVFPRMSAERSGSHSSQDEQADEREEFESELAQEQSLESRLAEVKRALSAMDKGTYGKCITCGGEIPMARLRANPAAEYDINHQPRE